MLGTLTLAAGTAAAGWLAQHAYQSLRYSFYEREDAAMLADVQAASSEGARYAAANPTLSNDAIAAYVREACALGDGATVTVTSAEAPSKPVTLKSGDKSVTARYAREKVTVKVVENVGCIFPLKSLGVKGATDDGWQVHSETSSIRSEIERS